MNEKIKGLLRASVDEIRTTPDASLALIRVMTAIHLALAEDWEDWAPPMPADAQTDLWNPERGRQD